MGRTALVAALVAAAAIVVVPAVKNPARVATMLNTAALVRAAEQFLTDCIVLAWAPTNGIAFMIDSRLAERKPLERLESDFLSSG